MQRRWRLNRETSTYDQEVPKLNGWEKVSSLDLGTKHGRHKCGGDVLDVGSRDWGVCWKCGAEVKF